MSKYYLCDDLNEDLAKKSECTATIKNGRTMYSVSNDREESFVNKADSFNIIVMRISAIEGLKMML